MEPAAEQETRTKPASAGLMFDDFSKCESPIEAIMQLAMAKASRLGRLEFSWASNIDELMSVASERGFGCVVVGAQVRFPYAKARADFALAHQGYVIDLECDGTDYHTGLANVIRDRNRDARIARLPWAMVYRVRGGVIAGDSIGVLSNCMMALGTIRLSQAVGPLQSNLYTSIASNLDKEALSIAAQTLTMRTGLHSACAVS